jgi:AhpD family alkylhydroperoxidase
VLSNALREAIMLAVAAENRCRYCQLAHAAFGQAAGLSPGEVEAILAGREGEGLSARERLALAYARDLARRGLASRDEDLRARLLERYTAREVEAIEATARVMNLANRFGNTFDAGLARIGGRCDRSGAGLLDLSLLAPLFVAGATAAAPAYLATELLNRLGVRR